MPREYQAPAAFTDEPMPHIPLTPQFLLPIHRELVIDLFAGGGGASTGIEEAIQ